MVAMGPALLTIVDRWLLYHLTQHEYNWDKSSGHNREVAGVNFWPLETGLISPKEKHCVHIVVILLGLYDVVWELPESRKRAPMSGAPYKSATEGGGRSFNCYHERVPMSVTWCPQSQINGQTIIYNGTTSLQSQVMTMHNTLDGNLSPWAWW